jgi:uncharacterized protein YyaL (SSP411 family)
MDETTYSHKGVIDLINGEYVPIRVDNDVRPDINQRYNMGGWPTTAFLTPSGDILTGATYMPPDQMADALSRVVGYYRTHQTEIATGVLESRKRASSCAARSAGELDDRLVDTILDAVKNAHDPEYGGFGNAPGFPQTDARRCSRSRRRSLRPRSARWPSTLPAMAGGGTYHHVGAASSVTRPRTGRAPFREVLEDHSGLVNACALALAGMDDALDLTTHFTSTASRDPKTGLYAGSRDADEHYYSLWAQTNARSATGAVRRSPVSRHGMPLGIAYLDAAVRRARRTSANTRPKCSAAVSRPSRR